MYVCTHGENDYILAIIHILSSIRKYGSTFYIGIVIL